jgi:peptidoglycan/xylan/chitin deacetylase (PgdA/CDA1 family)
VHHVIKVGLLVLVLLIGGALTRRSGGSRLTRIAGAFVVVLAGWLFPQRHDLGTSLVCTALFGAGLGLLFPRAREGSHRLARRLTASVTVVAVLGFGAYVGAETVSIHWFGGGITHGSTHSRVVALTFDDGPNVTSTLEIMKILNDAGVKGTFFEVGKAIDADPQITRALYEHGQLLGNHSYEHDQWRWLDPRYPELERAQQAFRRAIGVCPAYYRPPHGDRTPFIAHVVSDHHMRIVMWNASAGDWAEKSARTIARHIVRAARPGGIIVLHDGLDGLPKTNRTVLVRAMPLILAGLREKHLRPVGLDELIGGPAFVPC